MSDQLEFFPDPDITDDRKRRLILDIFACKKVSRPYPTMTIIEMGPVQIQAGIDILDRYLEETPLKTAERDNGINNAVRHLYSSKKEKDASIAAELDGETAEVGDCIRKMTDSLDAVLV